jgi:hypothetical protein
MTYPFQKQRASAGCEAATPASRVRAVNAPRIIFIRTPPVALSPTRTADPTKYSHAKL